MKEIYIKVMMVVAAFIFLSFPPLVVSSVLWGPNSLLMQAAGIFLITNLSLFFMLFGLLVLWAVYNNFYD